MVHAFSLLKCVPFVLKKHRMFYLSWPIRTCKPLPAVHFVHLSLPTSSKVLRIAYVALPFSHFHLHNHPVVGLPLKTGWKLQLVQINSVETWSNAGEAELENGAMQETFNMVSCLEMALNSSEDSRGLHTPMWWLLDQCFNGDVGGRSLPHNWSLAKDKCSRKQFLSAPFI